MYWLRVARARVRALFHRNAVADEIREELEFHLDRRTKDLARAGVPVDEAGRLAARRLGNVALLQDRGYDVRGGGLAESIAQDISHGVRALSRSRTYTVVTLAVLALAIGTTTSIFSVVDGVFLRGLPYDEPDRLVAVLGVDARHETTFGNGASTPQTYLDWRRRQESFEGLALVGNAFAQWEAGDGPPETVSAQETTGELFSILRTRPLLGRLLTPDDERPGGPRAVVLSYGFWQRAFGGASEAIGRMITVNNEPAQVVGVVPPDFVYPPSADPPTQMYVALRFREADRVRGGSHTYNGIAVGRLRPGTSIARALDEMNRIAGALDAEYPTWEPGWRVRVVPLHERLVGRTRGWMLLLLGAVGIVLLIACANVANLGLARAAARTREISLRAALGAGRPRIARALLIESLLLALTAGALGIAIAYGGVSVLRAWMPAGVPRISSIAVDPRVLGFAVMASLGTGVLFGVAPAIAGSRTDLTRALNAGGRGSTSGPGTRRLRHALVVVEIALSLVLVVGAGLFVTSFTNVVRIDPGIDVRNTLVLGVSLPRNPAVDRDESVARGQAWLADVFASVRRLPGVLSVAAVRGGSPLSPNYSRPNVSIPGIELGEGDGPDQRVVTSNYFSQLGIPVLQGRGFSEQDRQGAPMVIVVNEAASRKYWPGRSPVGQPLSVQGLDRTVIGVVADIRQYGLEQQTPATLYAPSTQEGLRGAELLIRTARDPMASLPAVKAALWSVSREQIFSPDISTLESRLDGLLAVRRFNMALLSILGLMGLVIAAVGIFGVMAYAVAQRMTEMGIRISLGATRSHILAMVLRDATALIAAGLLIGSVATWRLSSLAEAFLFQIRPADPRVFAGALGLLVLVGLIAALVPARRAASVDPLVALKDT